MKFITAIAALGLMGLAAPSSAAVFIATYQGSIGGPIDGIGGVYDGAGLFGPVDQNLVGKAVTAVFVYDTARGKRFTNAGAIDVLYGGTFSDVQSPIVSTTLTIDGITQALVGGLNDSHSNYLVEYLSGQSTATVTSSIQSDPDNYFGASVRSLTIPAAIPTSIETPFTLTGYFGGGGHFVRSIGVTGFGFAGLGTVTVAAVAAVPEPAVWLTLITGFGAVGGAMRSARRLPAAVSA